MDLDGTDMKRSDFLRFIRGEVTKFTGRIMRLDALTNEISKNIFDHGGKRGYLEIRDANDSFDFILRDYGEKAHEFQSCMGNSTKAGNGINYNIGLEMILDLAHSFRIMLCIDTSKGFCYSGNYTPSKTESRKREDFDEGDLA